MTKKKKEEQRQIIEVREDCDTGRLYGSIDDAISYLAEMRDKFRDCDRFGLEEHWTGYEDMEMVFSYYREESDEEFARRLDEEERQRVRAAEERRREDQRKADLKEFERLKARLGIWR
jgi:hypothetical protein